MASSRPNWIRPWESVVAHPSERDEARRAYLLRRQREAVQDARQVARVAFGRRFAAQSTNKGE